MHDLPLGIYEIMLRHWYVRVCDFAPGMVRAGFLVGPTYVCKYACMYECNWNQEQIGFTYVPTSLPVDMI